MTESAGPDERHLDGHDPYDLLDAEAARLESWLGGFADDDPVWEQASRCDGWTVRDVLAHLAAVEEYHHACLDGKVQQFLEAGLAQGYTGLDDFNQGGIDGLAGTPPSALLAAWSADDAETRRRLRERDGGDIDSTVGPYPLRWQAFHVAVELAVHADDIGLPISPDEAPDRLAWRTAFSRFAVTEKDTSATVEDAEGGTRIVIGDADLVVDDATLVDAVDGRLGDDADPAVRAAIAGH